MKLTIQHTQKGKVEVLLPNDTEIKVTGDKISFKGPETGTLQEWKNDIFTTVTIEQ